MPTNEWVMYCHKKVYSDKTLYMHFSPIREIVKLYGSGDIVKVHLKEDEAGTYWGWLRTGEENVTMIWYELGLLKMCFAYGIEIAEKHGEGRRVCMKLTELEN